MGERGPAVEALQARLGYQFKDAALLERALTHSSVGDGAKTVADNEVLEFLGDRVLGLLAAETLAQVYPDAKEGELARRLNSLVSGAACAKVARALGMGPALRVSPTTVKTGVRDTDSVLGGAFEALIAAVYLDAGLDRTREAFLPHLRENFATGGQGARDPKTALQEWAQANGKPLPKYNVISRTGADHDPTFTIEALVEGVAPATAKGKSRREAEKAAAQALLKRENP